jgi:hypothetical protein
MLTFVQNLWDSWGDKPKPRQFKAYVAGKFMDFEKIRVVMTELKNEGIEITHDWTQNEAATENRHYDICSGEDTKRMGMFGRYDVEGVKSADVLVVIMDQCEYPYRGTWTEVGVALGSDIPIILYCPQPGYQNKNKNNVFFWDAQITHVKTKRELMYRLQKMINSVN